MNEVTVNIKVERQGIGRIEIEERGFVSSTEPIPGIEAVVKEAANRAKAAAWVAGRPR